MCFKDISESSDKGIAQLFNNYFFSVYVTVSAKPSLMAHLLLREKPI